MQRALASQEGRLQDDVIRAAITSLKDLRIPSVDRDGTLKTSVMRSVADSFATIPAEYRGPQGTYAFLFVCEIRNLRGPDAILEFANVY